MKWLNGSLIAVSVIGVGVLLYAVRMGLNTPQPTPLPISRNGDPPLETWPKDAKFLTHEGNGYYTYQWEDHRGCVRQFMVRFYPVGNVWASDTVELSPGVRRE